MPPSHFSSVTDIVLLVPGFLAFDTLGKHSYFAETVGSAISAGLTGTPGRTFLVQAISAPPVDSLLARQGALLTIMQQCLAEHPSARIHLLGHSTGGLDAELLTRVTDLRGAVWDENANAARRRLCSLVSIAAPLAGTTLASAPLAAILAEPVSAWPRAVVEATRRGTLDDATVQLLQLGAAFPRLLWDRAFKNILSGVLTDTSRLFMFLGNIVWRHGLIADLQPERVAGLMAAPEDPKLPRFRRARFLTVAPETERPTPEAKLFDAFYSATKQAASTDPVPSFVPELQRRIRQGQILSIGDSAKLRKQVDALHPGDNDGIVNTLRQLMPPAGARFQIELDRTVAIVLADHLDVVGYYPSNKVSGKPTPNRRRADGTQQNGFLESGANFRDQQLTALYTLVAEEIRSASVDATSTPSRLREQTSD